MNTEIFIKIYNTVDCLINHTAICREWSRFVTKVYRLKKVHARQIQTKTEYSFKGQ